MVSISPKLFPETAFTTEQAMKRSHLLGALAGAIVCMSLVSGFVGCTAAQLSSADSAIGGTPLIPSTGPTSQPGVNTTLQPTASQAAVHLAQDATAEAAPIVAAVVPSPWGAIAAAGLGILSAVLGIFATKQTSRANTAESVIAAAAPGVASLVQQVTDNKSLTSDVTSIAQVAPGVISLLTHPTASSMLQATGTVLSSISNAN
jgi:hypothetical protein